MRANHNPRVLQASLTVTDLDRSLAYPEGRVIYLRTPGASVLELAQWTALTALDRFGWMARIRAFEQACLEGAPTRGSTASCKQRSARGDHRRHGWLPT